MQWYKELPAEDPHHLQTDEEKRAARIERMRARASVPPPPDPRQLNLF